MATTVAKQAVRGRGKQHRAEGSRPRTNAAMMRVLGASLFLSGAAALMYQILWIKQLSLIVGVEVFSIAIAVSAFFGGLALGGFLMGRYADRFAAPLRTFALLEAGTALLALIATIVLAHSARLFIALEAVAGPLAWLLPLCVVAVPAVLMGGTLPVAIRCLSGDEQSLPHNAGIFYALNTTGGIVGVLCCAFMFLPRLGVFGSSCTAAALNVISALIVFVLAGYRRTTSSQLKSKERPSSFRSSRFALALYFAAGAIALGYEVVWSQAIVQFLSTSSFAFAIVLATYLTGLALGSALYARYESKVSSPWTAFGCLIGAAGLVALLEIACISLWQIHVQEWCGDLVFALTGAPFAAVCTRFAVAALGIVFIPTLLLGAAFPAVLRLATGEQPNSRVVGSVIAVNTIGGICGSLITGFVLVPSLGVIRTIGCLAIAGGVVGVIAAVRGSNKSTASFWIPITIATATTIVCIVTPADRLARLLVPTRGGGALVHYEEGKGGTVAVLEQGVGSGAFRRLYVHGVSNSGDAMPSVRYMRLQALLPLLIHEGEPHSALVIGFGTGITAGALSQYPGLNRKVVAELLPSVVRASKLFLGNYGASSDPNLHIHIADGRVELMRQPDRYDLITLEPPPPSASGVANLYSSDFYKLAATRLNPNGLFAQWLPIATQNEDETRSLINSFLDVFPHATLWTTEMHEMLLVGSLEPIHPDAEVIEQRFNQPSVSAALGQVGISNPAALLATWVMGTDGLREYAGGQPAVTDDRPRIEYSTWVEPDEIVRALPNILSHRTDIQMLRGSSALSGAIAAERINLTTFYQAGLDAYMGQRQEWAHDIGNVLKRDPGNPYYRWATGRY